MARQNDINKFLKDNDLCINVLQYQCSQYEPVTDKTVTTLFSNERRRLTENEKRFQLFNEYGELFVDGGDIYDLYQKIQDMQKNGIGEPIHNGDKENEVIMNMVELLKEMGLTVWGTNQKIYDRWKVLDDTALVVALHEAKATGKEQLHLVQDDEGIKYLINDDNKEVLTPISELPEYNCKVDFYEVHNPDGQVVLKDIPFYKLALVLLAIIYKFNVQQVKNQFLWPKLSRNVLGNSRLLFERSFSSDKVQIKTLADLKSVKGLDTIEDENHIEAKYYFDYESKQWDWNFAFPDSDMEAVYNRLYHDIPIDSKDVTNELTETFTKVADAMGLVILRREQSLMNLGVVDNFEVTDYGRFKIGADETHNYETDNYVVPAFSVINKNTDVIKDNVTIDELIAFLWQKSEVYKNM